MGVHVNNPYNYFYNVAPNLKSCGKGGNANCTCSDPSWIYTKPCKLNNQADSSTQCYFVNPDNQAPGSSGPVPSNNGSFTTDGLKGGYTYTIGTTNGPNQAFFGSNQPGTTVQGSSAKYPLPALVCATQGIQSNPSAQPTPPKPNIGRSSNGNFTGWSASTYNQQFKGQSNLGFEYNKK